MDSPHIVLPTWARLDALPIQPKVGNFGFKRDDGMTLSFEAFSPFKEACIAEKKFPPLVWTPRSDYLTVIEECHELRTTFLAVSRQRALERLLYLQKVAGLLGLVVVLLLLWRVAGESSLIATIQSTTFVLVVMAWIIFAIIPLYGCVKYLRISSNPNAEFWEKEVADARFEYWLKHQRAPVSGLLSVLMIGLGLIQLYLSRGFDWSLQALDSVALTKGGEDPFWRYMTGPVAHGNLLHWIMNFGALRYLAKRVELLVGWQHMLWVLVFSAYAGAVATVNLMPNTPSVGISGGVLGLMGFLIGFETRHKNLVPKSPRRRLLISVIFITLLGALGYRFIDNASHAGGVLAGIFYGIVVFPSSTSVQSPEVLKRDHVLGIMALLLLLSSFVLCACRLVV